MSNNNQPLIHILCQIPGIVNQSWTSPIHLWNRLRSVRKESLGPLLEFLHQQRAIMDAPHDWRECNRGDLATWIMKGIYMYRFGPAVWDLLAPSLLAQITVETDRAVPAAMRHLLENYSVVLESARFDFAMERIMEVYDNLPQTKVMELPYCVDVDVHPDTTCPICQESFVICIDCTPDSTDAPYQTMCGHTFHHGCLQQWMQSGKACPMCRSAAI
jgi:hypothetical protein